MKLRIGRDQQCDWVIDQPQISRIHAELSQLSENVWLLEDLDSTGGTFVNGRRIKRAAITTHDHVLLSGVPFELTEAMSRSVPPPKKDPKTAFEDLKAVYETYESTRLKIQRDTTIKVTAVRAGFSLIPFVGNALGILASGQITAQEKMLALDKEFRLAYTCPACKTFLGATPWEGLVQMGACPRCRTPWH